MAALPRLARLKIDMRCSSSSLAAVAPKLSSVTRLRLSGALPPAAAPALTGLLHLHVQRWEPALAADHLQRMLQPLRQLTALVLDGGAFLHALPALAGLERLQRCYFRVGGQEELPDLELPEGPYLASLRWLGTGFRVLLNSMDTLASAPRLECLSIIEPLEEEPDLGYDTFVDWAAAHPPLQRLGFDFEGATVSWTCALAIAAPRFWCFGTAHASTCSPFAMS